MKSKLYTIISNTLRIMIRFILPYKKKEGNKTPLDVVISVALEDNLLFSSSINESLYTTYRYIKY